MKIYSELHHNHEWGIEASTEWQSSKIECTWVPNEITEPLTRPRTALPQDILISKTDFLFLAYNSILTDTALISGSSL